VLKRLNRTGDRQRGDRSALQRLASRLKS